VTDPRTLPRGQGELVLVVDDEQAIRGVDQRTLTRFGSRVVLAADGKEAVSIYTVRQQEIDVVLTDMAMPTMDGPATIRALREINPQVRIIGSSGHATSESVGPVKGNAVLHFVPKPYAATTLVTAIHKALKGS
jgi:DNA-binding NtrC family response regulator